MLNYRVEGEGPPLLLVHGFGVTFAVWDNLAPLLRPHFQLIMVELPGIGQSPPADPAQPYYAACAEAIAEVRQTLGVERWAVLGYSSGTRATEAYLNFDAAHVSRAVFLCPAYVAGWRPLGLRLGIALDHRWPPLGSWVLSGWRLYALVVVLGFNGRWNPYAAAWNREIKTQPIHSLKHTLRDLPAAGRARFDLPPVPTLFVWGRRDIVPSRPRRPRPNDRFIPADHSAPVRAAPAVAEVILPFLKE